MVPELSQRGRFGTTHVSVEGPKTSEAKEDSGTAQQTALRSSSGQQVLSGAKRMLSLIRAQPWTMPCMPSRLSRAGRWIIDRGVVALDQNIGSKL